jgi:hypothetical protein
VQLLNIKRRKDGNKVGVEFLACVDCSTFEFIRAAWLFRPQEMCASIDDVARTFYYWVAAAAVIPPITHTHTHRELNLIKMCVMQQQPKHEEDQFFFRESVSS